MARPLDREAPAFLPIGADGQHADGPELTPLAALARLAEQTHVAMLHACGLGWSYLTWGVAPLAMTDFSRCSPAGGGWSDIPLPALTGTWSEGFAGGALIQTDYEFPTTPARVWPVDDYVAWDPAGRCTLHARDAAGLARLRAGLARPGPAIAPPALATPLIPVWDASGHRRRIARLRAFIAAGDIYQANLTLSFHARLRGAAHRDLAVFLALVAASPAPYCAFFRAPDRSVVSHSPECFLTMHGAVLASEPIKGTRRRVAGAEPRIRGELLAAEKDRAELAMIVDLMRNDLGRVARPGSVRVDQPARVMDLPYVHHLVARIVAERRPEIGFADVLAATFPAGSITGAPKLRAMQIIGEAEAGPRGPYCGAFGWLSGDSAELAVAIRTLTVCGDAVRLDAGGGIVADSDPAAEWDEVRAKAVAMAQALGTTV